MLDLAIVADIGGSHITSVAVDIDSHYIMKESFSRVPVNSHAPIGEIISTWSEAINDTIAKTNGHTISGVGIAIPGPFDYLNGISLLDGSNGKYGSTCGRDIGQLLSESLSADYPIRFINDATAYGMGEDVCGASKLYASSIALTLGTGLGSAFITDGLPVVNGEKVPENGCLWHLPFRDGTVEDYFSSRGLIARYEAQSGHKVATVKEIAELVMVDETARSAMEDFGLRLAECLAPWIKVFEPDCVVIGGNISRAFEYFGPSMQKATNKSELKIVTTALFEEAALIGASRLIEPGYFERIYPLLPHLK
ncbi:ROK family protein [Marinoscillum sp. MHG1-6]|uniref:ROK family protein n=1 Tax=Marinoscillum sp. MHG1-6 TaxID=2959627 RepID=UPI00215791FD|nr:ROK family protein [Marinoscillum sp. MHG1-6]